MKKSITTIFICSILLIPVLVNAQIDQTRMDKDLRVAANVLEMLTRGDNHSMMYGNNVEGNYIEGYGVIFTLGRGYSIFTAASSRVFNYSYSWSYGGRDAVIVAPKSDNAGKEKDDNAKDDAKNQEQADIEQTMIDFLANYSQLISQLKPTDKVVVSTSRSNAEYVVVFRNNLREGRESQGITAELLKKDHNDYISGKISNNQLIAKIKITRTTGDEGRSKDLDLFGSMLKTIYDDGYTDSYFMSWEPKYERLKGIGVIYSFKVYSSYEEDGLYRMPGINEKGLTNSQRNEKVIALYPVFIKSMRENIIQYGRTITSLDSDEVVLLKISLTKCDGCSIPKKIQFSVKQSVLVDFNSGKLSQKDAIAKVVMSEL